MRKSSLIFMGFLIIIVSFYMGSTFFKAANNDEIQKNNKLSMIEAISLGQTEANKKLGKGAKLFDVTSVDHEESSINDGASGKRSMWNLTFADKDNKHPLYITIKNGKITFSEEELDSKILPKSLINIPEIKKDSSFYLNKAINEQYLKPGEKFAKGYHFVLSKHEESDPIITIYGENNDGFITRIDFNVKTDQFLASYSKLPSESGLYQYNNKNIIEKNNAVIGTVFTKNLSHQAIWGYEKPGSTDSTFIRLKEKGAKEEWETLNIDENEIIDVWFSEQYAINKKIIYATSTEIKSYNTSNGHSETLFHDNTILKVIHSTKFISVLTQDHIYISNNNGVNWETILSDKDVSDIEFDDENKLYFKKHDTLFKKETKDSKIDIPNLDGEILGYKVKNDQLYLYTNQTILHLDLQTNKSNEYVFDKPINNIFLDENNPYRLFIISENVITKLESNKGGDGFVSTELMSEFNGIASSVVSTSEGLWISFVPNFKWEVGDFNE